MKSIYKIALGIFVFFSFGLGQVLAASAPTATTLPATFITPTKAVLNGHFDVNILATAASGPSTDVRFEYGTTTLLGTKTAYETRNDEAGDFVAYLSDLLPNTKYYFRAMAVNTNGIGYATSTLFFTTADPAPAPSIMTTPATVVGQSTATLNGYYNNAGFSTDVWFEYGTDPLLGVPQTTPKTTKLLPQSGTFSVPLTGLTAGTKYYFRAVGQSVNGKKVTSVIPFTTSSAAILPCTVTSFTADNANIASGATTILRWTTSNCDGASINNSIGAVTPVASGSLTTGALTATTTFTIAATGTTAIDYKTITVTVGASTGSTCAITSFTASPWNVSYNNSTSLYWNTSGNCNVSIDRGIGNVNASGSTTTANLTTSTTFTLSATDTNTNITQTRQIIIGVTTGSTSTVCSITNFSSGLSTVARDGSTYVTWTTNGCDRTALSSSNGYYASVYQPTSGSVNTGALSTTTTFTLYAYGQTSTQQSLTINVTGGVSSYIYGCSDRVDNDGDGLIDYPADPGCISAYDNDEYNTYGTNAGSTVVTNSTGESAITTMATNVGASTARLNGILSNITTLFTSSFEYGTTTNLGIMTNWQNLNPTPSATVYATIETKPDTTYYYRVVGQFGSKIVRGAIMSFTTASSTDETSYAGNGSGASSTNDTWGTSGTSSSSSSSTSGTTTAATIALKITNKEDKVHVNDTIEYQADYINNTDKTVKDATITIILPQGFNAKQTTQGVMLNLSSISIPIGTLVPGQKGTVYFQATVDKNVALSETLVTNGTLTYTLPNGSHDSAVGYVLNHAEGQTIFSGFTLGSGFFPTTIFGWFMTIIIILIIILIARRIAKSNSAGHGEHH